MENMRDYVNMLENYANIVIRGIMRYYEPYVFM